MTMRRGLAVGSALLLALLAAGFLAPDPNLSDFDAVLVVPGIGHPFGTDQLGRDVLARVLSAGRVALLVGLVSVAAGLVLGGSLGLLAGYAGGWADVAVTGVTDVMAAFPAVLLALALATLIGPGLANVTLAIAVANLPVFARLARSQTRLVRELGYVEAHRAIGFGPLSIMLGTIAPNILAPLVTQACLLFASSILMESYLSFLGVGLQPPQPTWGRMLYEATGFLDQAPWLVLFPGCAITMTVLFLNVVGDSMADRLDPRDVLVISPRDDP